MAKSEVTKEEVTAIGTAPVAPSDVFKEDSGVVVAQASTASATDTSESTPAAESSAETPAAAESTETTENTELTEAALDAPTEGATGASEGEGLLKEGEEGLLEGGLAAPGGASAGGKVPSTKQTWRENASGTRPNSSGS